MRIALVSLVVIFCSVAFLPEIMSLSPYQANPSNSLVAPNHENWFGTDLLGRDLFSRILYGGRRTLGIALCATAIAMIGGGVLGVLAGQYNQSNWLISPALNALLSIPTLLIAMVILSVFGNKFWQLVVSLGISQMANYALVLRSATRELQPSLYIHSATAFGATRFHILKYHILPNIRNIALSYGGVIFSYNVLNEATLNFLGLGGELGEPDWGGILNEGRTVLHTNPWISLIPGILIIITVYCVNTIVDRIR